MYERIEKLFKPAIILAAVVFAVCYFFSKPQEFGDYISYLNYSVLAVAVCFGVYEKWLWRMIPWNRPPVLKTKYTGVIKYLYKDYSGEKSIHVKVKQSWLSIDIKTETDINSSVTVAAFIVHEYDNYVLYYIYITNPTAATQTENPIQYGTCRMLLNGDNSKIYGKYWTTSKTIGDIKWNAD